MIIEHLYASIKCQRFFPGTCAQGKIPGAHKVSGLPSAVAGTRLGGESLLVPEELNCSCTDFPACGMQEYP